MILLWQLFVSYLKIGFFGFGGGYAMLSLIQHEVVVQHAWMTAGEFTDIVAISQITPGPIAINSATYVGYTVGMQTGHVGLGILGSAIATFAVCLPSFTLMVLVARFFMRLHNNRLVEGAMRGMRPTVIGMIAAAALLLIVPHGSDPDEQTPIDPWSWALFGGDSDVDMCTGNNAGVMTVGVSWGFRSREILKETGADVIIDHPEELTVIVNNTKGEEGKNERI